MSGPTTGISAWRIFPTSAASMSKWITFAPGANADTLPVTRSSKREPIAITRSALFSAQFANFEPCMPGRAVVERMRVRKTPLPHQGYDCGKLRRVNEFE